jgi:hypothetical protein
MQCLELPEQTRLSLLRGYLERSWRRPDVAAEQAAIVDRRISDQQAYLDGRRLRDALDGLIAAGTFDELNVAEQVYDDLARELNARYGQGLVVLSCEDDEPGIRGFRTEGFATRSSVLVGEERIAG